MNACALLLERHKVNSGVSAGKLFHAHIRPTALPHCATHMEAFKEIARGSGGAVRMSEAGRLVKEAGLSKGKASSITSSMYNRVESSTEWEYLEPGTYHLVEYAGDAHSDDVAHEEEPRPDEPSMTDNYTASRRSSPYDAVSEVALGRITA